VVKDSKICGGQPTIVGTRLTVFNVVWGILGDGLDSYATDHDLPGPKIKDALAYCKELLCQDNVGGYCYGCIMSTIKGQVNKGDEDAFEVILQDNSKITIEGTNIFLGDKNELDHARFGEVGWGIAEELYNKYYK
jgi:uncharacterized protein (DUF433 family)